MNCDGGSCEDRDQADVVGLQGGKAVSRRHFLKLAAVAGCGVGLGGGLGVLLPACSSSETDTISGSTPDTSAVATGTAGLSTSSSEVATSATSGSEGGRPIKLGYVVPITGPLSPFASAARWSNEHFTKAIGDGIVCGDKKKHPVEVVVADSQSDAARAAGVAGDLIQNSKVDLLMTAVTADTVIPAQTVAESFGCPCIANWSEWHADILQRSPPAEGFKWTYVYDFDDIGTATNYVAAFSQVDTNKRVGLVLANDLHGNSWAQFAPPVLSAGGYTVVETDQYSPGAEDYTAQISLLKKEGCEIRWAPGDDGLRELLEPGASTGLQPQGGLCEQGPDLPRGGYRNG